MEHIKLEYIKFASDISVHKFFVEIRNILDTIQQSSFENIHTHVPHNLDTTAPVMRYNKTRYNEIKYYITIKNSDELDQVLVARTVIGYLSSLVPRDASWSPYSVYIISCLDKLMSHDKLKTMRHECKNVCGLLAMAEEPSSI